MLLVRTTGNLDDEKGSEANLLGRRLRRESDAFAFFFVKEIQTT